VALFNRGQCPDPPPPDVQVIDATGQLDGSQTRLDGLPTTTMVVVVYLARIGQLNRLGVFINEAADGAEILAEPKVH